MKYRIKERFNIFNGRMWAIQERILGFLWADNGDWFLDKDRRKVKKIVNNLNAKKPIRKLLSKCG
jgi:hypothetical protein